MHQYVFVDLDNRWLPAVQRVRSLGYTISYICPVWHGEFEETWRNVADKILFVEDSSVATLLRIIKSENERIKIGAMLCDQDAFIEQVSCVCQMLQIPFTNYQGVKVARCKFSTRKLLLEHGLPSPKFRHLPNLENLDGVVRDIGFPCIVKPSKGSGSRVCYPLYDASHISWFKQEALRVSSSVPAHLKWVFENGFLCEELLFGSVVSVAVAAVADKYFIISSALHMTQDTNPCVGFGSVLPLDGHDSKFIQVKGFALKVCKLLELRAGVFDVEFMLTGSGPVLLEVNPRPMGGEMVAAYGVATGNSLFSAVVDIYSGRASTPKLELFESKALIYKLIAKSNGRISNQTSASSLNELIPSDIVFKNYRIFPEQPIHELEVMGRLIVKTEDPSSEFVRLESVGEKISQLCNVPILFGNPPCM